MAVNPRVVGSSPTLPSFMVFLAEWFRRRIVVPVYVGSNPTEHPFIGLWCNGNTTDSGPVISGSNPDNPTNFRRVAQWFRAKVRLKMFTV